MAVSLLRVMLCISLVLIGAKQVEGFHGKLGEPQIQFTIGQRYLHGKGVEKHEDKAMDWFKKAADQGHPHASYNLAIGHLKGFKSGLKPGEAHALISHAASKGVPEANQALNEVV